MIGHAVVAVAGSHKRVNTPTTVSQSNTITGAAALTVGELVFSGTGTVAGTPIFGVVDDLTVVGKTSSTMTVEWTEVNDGTGNPARYLVRWALSPFSDWDAWIAQTIVEPTSIGATASYTATGLNPNTTYTFRLLPFRGSGGNEVFGQLSNTDSDTTLDASNPAGWRANEPAATTSQITDNHFAALPISGWWGPDGNSSLFSLENGPTPSGDDRFLRHIYPAGFEWTHGPGTYGTLFARHRRVYVCWFERVSHNMYWLGGGSGGKLGPRINDVAGGSSSIFTFAVGGAQEIGAFAVWNIQIVSPLGGPNIFGNVGNPATAPGEWAMHEIYAVHNNYAAGAGPQEWDENGDGEFHWWINGNKCFEYTGWNWPHPPTGEYPSGIPSGWAGIKWDPNRSIPEGTGLPEADWIDLDRCYISVGDPY